MIQDVFYGGDFKVNVHFDPVDGYGMDNTDFTCAFRASGSREMKLSKEDMIRVDGENYVACLCSRDLSRGPLTLRLEVLIPDTDFPAGVRREVEVINVGIVIK